MSPNANGVPALQPRVGRFRGLPWVLRKNVIPTLKGLWPSAPMTQTNQIFPTLPSRMVAFVGGRVAFLDSPAI